MSECYAIPGEAILHEAIDNEVVIVNLDKGTYYSLEGVAAFVWGHLAAGITKEALKSRVRARFEGDQGAMDADLEAFLGQLQQEELVAKSAAAGTEVPAEPVTGERQPYSAPVLNIHTDMEQLLLVDPIHEVEESGWPDVK